MEIVRQISLGNKYGLHARASSRLAMTAQQFKAAIRVGRVGAPEEVDAKSIIAMLTLGAPKGVALSIRVTGEDAELAMAAVIDLIEQNFGEE